MVMTETLLAPTRVNPLDDARKPLGEAVAVSVPLRRDHGTIEVLAVIATPADAAMMMQLGAEGVFVGSGIFKSGNPQRRAEAIVKVTTFYDDPGVVAKVSRGLGEAMVGINIDEIPRPHRLSERGWWRE